MGKRAVNSRNVSAGNGAAPLMQSRKGNADRRRHLGQGAEKLRHGRQQRGPMLHDFHDDVLGRMQRFDEHNRAADEHGQKHANRQHEAVKHRQQHDEAVLPHRLQHVRQLSTLASKLPCESIAPLGWPVVPEV